MASKLLRIIFIFLHYFAACDNFSRVCLICVECISSGIIFCSLVQVLNRMQNVYTSNGSGGSMNIMVNAPPPPLLLLLLLLLLFLLLLLLFLLFLILFLLLLNVLCCTKDRNRYFFFKLNIPAPLSFEVPSYVLYNKIGRHDICSVCILFICRHCLRFVQGLLFGDYELDAGRKKQYVGHFRFIVLLHWSDSGRSTYFARREFILISLRQLRTIKQ